MIISDTHFILYVLVKMLTVEVTNKTAILDSSESAKCCGFSI